MKYRFICLAALAVLAAFAAGGTTLAVASPRAVLAKKHHKKHHKKKKHKKPTTSSFKGCSGEVTGTVVQGAATGPYPYLVRFVCGSSSNFSSFKITLNRTITTANDPRGDWSCAAGSTTISCTSNKGPFNFQNDDPLGISIGLNMSSSQTPCGPPALSGQVTVPGDSSSIQLTPETNDCP